LQTRYGLVTEVNSKGTGLISKYVQPVQQSSEVEDTGIEQTEQSEFNFNYGEELAEVLRAEENRGNKNLTLDDALKMIGKTRKNLRDFIKYTLDKKFDQFYFEVNDDFYIDGILDLPNFVSEGLTATDTSSGSPADFARANRKLNLIKDPEYNLKQIYLNNWINASSMNDILLGDQAMSFKNSVEAVKRAKMNNAAYYSAASKIAAPEINILNPLAKISMFATTDPTGTSIHTGEKIEQADAQNYGTIKAFKYMWFGVGKLTPKQNLLIEKIERGERVSSEDIFGAMGAAKKQEMLNSKKLVYGDGEVFDKFSFIALSKELTSKKVNGVWVAKEGREELHNMRVKMEQYEQDQLDEGIDTIAMVAPLSALKMQKYNITPIDDFVNNKEKIKQSEQIFLGPAPSGDYMNRRLDYQSETGSQKKLGNSQVMDLDPNFMGLQVLNPSNKTVIIDPTQIKTLITGELDDDIEVWIGGKKTDIGKLRLRYNQAIKNRLDQKYLDKRNLVFDLDPEYAMDQLHKSIEAKAITPDLYAFLEYAKTSLESSQTAAELLEFFTVDEDGNPNYEYAQDTPIIEGKFKQLFLSFFSKGVMSEKIPGVSAALLSDYGFKQFRKVYSVEERNGKPYIDRQEVIRTNDFNENYSIDDVQMYGDNPLDLSDDDMFDVLQERVSKLKKGEYIIVKDRLRPDMKEYDGKGKYTGIRYTESLLPAHSKDVYTKLDLKSSEKIPDVVSKMFGIRIPSQDNHSTINIKVVDFLPVFYGSTIVSARELVEVSGADFDIDKLYAQMKEYYISKTPTDKTRKIYDVVVDMYEHKTEVDATGDPVDIWVVDNLKQAQQ
jgi:hypothetical protein